MNRRNSVAITTGVALLTLIALFAAFGRHSWHHQNRFNGFRSTEWHHHNQNHCQSDTAKASVAPKENF